MKWLDKRLDELLEIPVENLTKSQKWQIIFLFELDDACSQIRHLPYLARAKIWNAGILLWWYRLYIRPDEFDVSLRFDPVAWKVMSEEKRYQYNCDLAVRRLIAHNRNRRGIENNRWRLVIEDITNHIMPSVDYEMARKDVEQNKSINILRHIMHKEKGDLDAEKE